MCLRVGSSLQKALRYNFALLSLAFFLNFPVYLFLKILSDKMKIFRKAKI